MKLNEFDSFGKIFLTAECRIQVLQQKRTKSHKLSVHVEMSILIYESRNVIFNLCSHMCILYHQDNFARSSNTRYRL